MYFYIYISILFCNAYSTNGDNVTDNVLMKVTDIANVFITTLFNNNNNNRTDNKRIKDLKEKLIKIDSYVVDKDKYVELIQNTSKENDLNATNFYEALLGQDHFRLLNHSKNLYLTMKEKMNSDDLLRILSERGEEKVRTSARRMLTGDAMLKRQRDKDLAETVDKYLGEIATDYHTFDDSVKLSNYWDPKIELEERQLHNQQSGRRLYKGERTTIRYYPFIVSVHVMGKFWCGGCIYWNDLIITSAACLQIVYNNRFYRENPKAITVRVGSNHSVVGGEMVEALEVYFHPSYNPKTLNNNIALIRLRRQIHINYHRTPKLIQISHNDQGISFTAQVLLLGWGVTKENARLRTEPHFLQRKFLPIYPATYCKDIYGDQFNPRTMFCAGTVTTGEGACNHDAGGPAILNGMLVGIISYGPTVCGFPDAPTVLTMVGVFADWIETVNESMPGYYRFNARTTTTTENTIDQEFAKWRKNQNVNIKRLAPAIFVNEEDYREAEDRGQAMFRARLTDRIEKTKKPIPLLQPLMTTAHSRVYDKTNSPVWLTVREVKQKVIRADNNKPTYLMNEQRKEENLRERKENIIDVHKNEDDDDDKQEDSLQTLLPPFILDSKIYDKGQYALPSGRLIQQLQSLTGLSEGNEPARTGQMTYTSKAKYMGLSQKIKPIRNRPKTEVKNVQTYDYDTQSTIDDNIHETGIPNDEEIETTSDAIYPENEEKREKTIRSKMAQREYEYEDYDDNNNNILIKIKTKKQLFSPSDDQLNEKKSSYEPFLPNRYHIYNDITTKKSLRKVIR